VGDVVVKMETEDCENNVVISGVELIPEFKKNLLSYVRLEAKGIRMVYIGEKRYLANKDGEKLTEVHASGNLLVVRSWFHSSQTNADLICSTVAAQDHGDAHEDSLFNFHVRLGHLSYAAIEDLASKPESGIKLTDRLKPNCIGCAEGKQTRNNQPKKDSGANSPIDRIGGVICSDLKGPVTPHDRLGNRYLVNFIDYRTNYCRVFLAKTKDQAAKKFEHFLAFFERRFDCQIQVLRTDGGLEYRNVDFFCEQTGVARQTTEPNNPASNGKAERMHRTVLNMARCMLFNSGMPIRFWGDAVKYAAYVLNRSPSRSNPGRKSPLEMLEGRAPSLTNIVTFGSTCMVFRDPNGKAFGKRAVRGVILGVPEETKGYVIYLPQDKKVVVTQHVKYIQTLSEAQNAALNSPSSLANGGADLAEGNQAATAPAANTRTNQQRKPSRRLREAMAACIEALDQQPDYVCNVAPGDPATYKTAMKTSNAAQWQAAVDLELDTLRSNQTWIALPKPKTARPLHSKWVFKTKLDANGGIERFKARLVACGNEQQYGVNYEDTFAPVLDLATARLVLALSVLWKQPARHGDIPAAYTRATLESQTDIYMYPPHGMRLSEEERLAGGEEPVLKLQRSLYGLKQAGRLWNCLLHEELIRLGYSRCVTDLCLYCKRSNEGTAIVGVYVDDLLATATNGQLIEDLFEKLKSLEVKDLGVVEKFLGMRVKFNSDGFSLDQETLIGEYLKANDMTQATPVTTPVCLSSALDQEELLPPADTKSFRTLAGGLLWLARCTRPDIAYAVHQLTRRTHAPRTSDQALGKRILRYLAGTASAKLVSKQSVPGGYTLSAFTDADYATNSDRKSISACTIHLNGMLVHWYCTKQSNISLSTMESEFVAAARGVQELLGCYEVLKEIGCPLKLPMTLHMDNQAAIVQVTSEASTQRSKHIDIKYKFLKDLYLKRIVNPVHVPTQSMLADLMTKALPTPDFRRLFSMIGLEDARKKEDTHRGGVLE
jgi:hypothetical protein